MKKQSLIEVKQALSDKYNRLVRVANSEPKKRQFATRAAHYARQVTQLKREEG